MNYLWLPQRALLCPHQKVEALKPKQDPRNQSQSNSKEGSEYQYSWATVQYAPHALCCKYSSNTNTPSAALLWLHAVCASQPRHFHSSCQKGNGNTAKWISQEQYLQPLAWAWLVTEEVARFFSAAVLGAVSWSGNKAVDRAWPPAGI